jgi:hypothetical protein
LNVQSILFVPPRSQCREEDPQQDQDRSDAGEDIASFDPEGTLATEPTQGSCQTTTASALKQNDGDNQEREDKKERTENVLGKNPKRHEHG